MQYMPTLDRFYGVRIGMSCSDRILDYAGGVSFVSGIIVIIFGMFSFTLGIAAVCTKSSAAFIGYGMWCGIMFVASGIVYMGTCKSGRACKITAVMTLATISIFCSVIQFSLGVFGTATDANRGSYYIDTKDQYVYDIFGPRNAAAVSYCIGKDDYDFVGSWAPINILLLLTGFFEFLCNLTVFIVTLVSLCCGNREVINYQGADNAGFSQIDCQSDTFHPQLYRVF